MVAGTMPHAPRPTGPAPHGPCTCTAALMPRSRPQRFASWVSVLTHATPPMDHPLACDPLKQAVRLDHTPSPTPRPAFLFAANRRPLVPAPAPAPAPVPALVPYPSVVVVPVPLSLRAPAPARATTHRRASGSVPSSPHRIPHPTRVRHAVRTLWPPGLLAEAGMPEGLTGAWAHV